MLNRVITHRPGELYTTFFKPLCNTYFKVLDFDAKEDIRVSIEIQHFLETITESGTYKYCSSTDKKVYTIIADIEEYYGMEVHETNMREVVKHEYDRLKNIKIIRSRTVYDSCIGQAQELRNLDLIDEYEFANLYDHLAFVFEHADSISKLYEEREDN